MKLRGLSCKNKKVKKNEKKLLTEKGDMAIINLALLIEAVSKKSKKAWRGIEVVITRRS